MGGQQLSPNSLRSSSSRKRLRPRRLCSGCGRWQPSPALLERAYTAPPYVNFRSTQCRHPGSCSEADLSLPAGVDGSPGSPGPLRAPPLPAQPCTLARRARFRALLGDHGDGAGMDLLRKIQSKRNLPWRRRDAPSAAAGSPQPAERGGWGEERAGRFWFRFFVPAPLEATKKRAALPPDPAVCYLVACGWELGLRRAVASACPDALRIFATFGSTLERGREDSSTGNLGILWLIHQLLQFCFYPFC